MQNAGSSSNDAASATQCDCQEVWQLVVAVIYTWTYNS